METIVEMVGLTTKIDTALIVKIIVVGIPNVAKIYVEGRACSSVDEVLGTSVNDVLSWIGAQID